MKMATVSRKCKIGAEKSDKSGELLRVPPVRAIVKCASPSEGQQGVPERKEPSEGGREGREPHAPVPSETPGTFAQ